MSGKCAVCGEPVDDGLEDFPRVCAEECLNTWWDQHEARVTALIDALRSARLIRDVAATTPEEQLLTIKAAHEVGLIPAELARDLGLTVESSHERGREAEEEGDRSPIHRRSKTSS